MCSTPRHLGLKLKTLMATPDLEQTLRAALARSGGASSDFDLNKGVVLPEGRTLSQAAVLVLFDPEKQTLLLTKRSARLKHHPGQIAFAGGKKDAGDADLTATALREAHEEVGLSPDAVTVLGALPSHETVTGFQVSPIVALQRRPFVPTPEVEEVSEVFSVPIKQVMNPANFRIEHRMWQGQRRFFYVAPYGPYYIWGATARILRGLADRWVA